MTPLVRCSAVSISWHLVACEHVSVSEKEEERLQRENSRLWRLLVQAGVDAAASDDINKLQRALIVEMHHRVKNLLAIVLSITSRTLQTSSNLASAEKAIFERIHTLSRTYDLLLNQGELEASPLKDILEHAVEAFNQAGQNRSLDPSSHYSSLRSHLPVSRIQRAVHECREVRGAI